MAEEENMQEHEQEQPPEAPAAAGQPTLSGNLPSLAVAPVAC